MSAEEPCFSLHCIRDAHPVVDILLRSALYSIVAQLKIVCGTIQQLYRVSPFIHEINFGDDANCALSLWIILFGHLKGVRVGQVDIRW